MKSRRFLYGNLGKLTADKNRFAYLFYWLVGLVMLALLILDLVSGGEVSLQLPIIFFMGILITGPIFFLIFVIPTVKFTIQVHSKPHDTCLLIWSWVHILFWLFIFNNMLFLVDAFVVFQDTIYIVWGGYAIIAASFPILYCLVKKEMIRVFLVLAAVSSVVLVSWFWDPRQGEFDVPSVPTRESIALLDAAQAGDISAVQSLLDQGADIHVKDDIGWDALHLAVFFGHDEMVKYLLEMGADPNTRGYKGSHSKLFAGSDTCSLIVGESSVLTTALRLGDAPIAQMLVESGAESGPNKSLLLFAALGDVQQLRSHLEALQGTLEKPWIKGEINRALNVAASRPDSDSLAVLLEFGADSDEGLWNAAAFSRPDNVKWLLEHGANPNKEYTLNGPPLMSGFNKRPNQKAQEIRETIELLIEAGADVNYIDKFGCGVPKDESVLIHTIRNRNFTAAEVLLENGADSGWQNSMGMTARDYAKALGDGVIVALLDKHSSN